RDTPAILFSGRPDRYGSMDGRMPFLRAHPSPSDPARTPGPFDRPALRTAWTRVRANGGACGADKVRLEVFERRLRANLDRLAAELECGGYRPGDLRRVTIARPDGGARELAIPDVRDRVVQTAVATHLCGRLDPRFAEGSFGYRPCRSVDDAVAALRRWQGQGRLWTFDADIRDFFGEVRHDVLLADLAARIGRDPRLMQVIPVWLAGFGRKGRGLAQGSPISPILANLYLDPLDRAFGQRGAPIVRYADDFVVPAVSRGEARAARGIAVAALARRGLRLNPAKTTIRAPGEAFIFLGRIVRAPAVPPPARPRPCP
ncbi:MAG TPA: reverse transcriptase domain-containing protein, partial [Caulobacteraceae bacterium]|nr:reverse transcriptase domain-containing protein [Caulobacteraceae bacterium]